jgi:hypothetical protein
MQSNSLVELVSKHGCCHVETWHNHAGFLETAIGPVQAVRAIHSPSVKLALD